MGQKQLRNTCLLNRGSVDKNRKGDSYISCSRAAQAHKVWCDLVVNMLYSINVVALHQTHLVPGWLTVCRRVDHFSI